MQEKQRFFRIGAGCVFYVVHGHIEEVLAIRQTQDLAKLRVTYEALRDEPENTHWDDALRGLLGEQA